MVGIIIATSLQVHEMSQSDLTSRFPWKNAYGYSYVAVLYAVIMLIVNLVFIYGVKKVSLYINIKYLL